MLALTGDGCRADRAVQALTGKQQLLGFSTDSQPILYLLPSKNDTRPSQLAVTHTVSSLLATAMAPADVTDLHDGTHD